MRKERGNEEKRIKRRNEKEEGEGMRRRMKHFFKKTDVAHFTPLPINLRSKSI
jgi:hypothetical protein